MTGGRAETVACGGLAPAVTSRFEVRDLGV
jgi:hypothetical protein